LVAAGEIKLSDKLSFAQRLSRLHRDVTHLVAEFVPAVAAVEAPFHGVSARSALQLAHARGVILAVLGEADIPVFEYAPATIKKAVTGSGRAEKQQVQFMVRRLIRGADEYESEDVSDAMAAALCHLAGATVSASFRTSELEP